MLGRTSVKSLENLVGSKESSGACARCCDSEGSSNNDDDGPDVQVQCGEALDVFSAINQLGRYNLFDTARRSHCLSRDGHLPASLL